MALKFYNEEYEEITDPLRTVHNGKAGGAEYLKVLIKNDDPTVYYTNVIVTYSNDLNDDYGLEGTSGWSVKMIGGSLQPSEQEWDAVQSGESILLNDIGTASEADTSTYRIFWIRVYCPGSTSRCYREGQKIRVYYTEGICV